eukprot:1228969-Amphidinium_carterae.2
MCHKHKDAALLLPAEVGRFRVGLVAQRQPGGTLRRGHKSILNPHRLSAKAALSEVHKPKNETARLCWCEMQITPVAQFHNLTVRPPPQDLGAL